MKYYYTFILNDPDSYTSTYNIYVRGESYTHRNYTGVCVEDRAKFIEQYDERYTAKNDPCWMYTESTEEEIKFFKRVIKLNSI